MAPWSISSTEAYGFAAAHRDQQCGTCWELTFNGQSNGNATNASSLSGKKLTVMISNIGGDVQGNQLDFLVPGGGVGAFDAFSSQIGVQKSALGAQYGGLVSDGCMGKPDCLRQKCDNVFSGKDWLKAGCNFYADWMGAVDNPRYNAKSVTCPAALVDRWKNAATGNPGSGNPNPPPPPPPSGTYTLTVNRNPTNGGTTNPSNSQSNINGGSQVNISATAASGYTFTNWTVSGSGTFGNANSASTTVTVNGNITVTANFTQGQGNGCPSGQTCGNGNPPSARGDTIKVEAENFSSKSGDNIKVEGGAIGWIENGNSTTYKVNIEKAGSATMQFMIATEVQSTFSVEVNGTNVGKISQGSTGNWSTFKIVQLSNAVNLRAGENTIVLKFESAVNVDYFLLIGNLKNTTSVRQTGVKAVSERSQVALRPTARGFIATLPTGHGFTSYRVIDLQGREVKSGSIGASTADLSVNGLKHSLVFLRLEGGNRSPMSLKVVTY
jgi:hypothetical protein